MFSPDDTIAAIATPPGRGGLGVIRVSGPAARSIAEHVLAPGRPLTPRLATLRRIRCETRSSSTVVDEIVATWFPAPRSYTGEDVVEISAHGSPVVLSAVVAHLITAGARLARPGEFTFRAFLNGRLDLVQAEAVGDLIDAVTPLQARVAFDQLEGTLSHAISAVGEDLLDVIARLEASLDFPDEGYHFIDPRTVASRLEGLASRLGAILSQGGRGRMIREGATVVIVGRPNVGKSSLFNALVGQERAIVTDVPGTTRDLLTERIDLDGLCVTLVDTAGVRDTVDVVEQQGVERAVRSREAADLVLVVIDSSTTLDLADRDLLDRTASMSRVLVANKADLQVQASVLGALPVSAKSGDGLEELRRAIVERLTGGEALRDTAALTNFRQIDLLKAVHAIIERAREVADRCAPEEFILADLHRARARLGEVLGVGASDDVLEHIFTRFCIGK
jgi:tRNA modification GTPase